MAPHERLDRMRRMRAVVRERNIYRWAANLIGDLCAVRTDAEFSPRGATGEAARASAGVG